MKTVSATIEIAAPPMAVWTVLTDLSRYPEWNPLFREASGEVAVGKRIMLKSVRPANGRIMTVKPKVTVVEPGAELRWVASVPGIMSGEHSFTLRPAGDGTHLVQSESFRGLLVPFSAKTFASAEASFRALNEALNYVPRQANRFAPGRPYPVVWPDQLTSAPELDQRTLPAGQPP